MKRKIKRGERLPLATSPIRHGYVTVVKLTLRDACHVWDWSSTVLFRKRQRKRQRQRESFSRFEYERARKLWSASLYGWQVDGEKLYILPSLGLGKFLHRRDVELSYIRSRDWRQCANAYTTWNNITSWRKSWQTLLKQVNICHSLELYSRFTYANLLTSDAYYTYAPINDDRARMI